MTKMHEIKEFGKEKAVLVSLFESANSQAEEYSLDELKQLADTAGVEIVGVVRQNKDSPDSRWFIGKGKVAEVRAEKEHSAASTIIFNQELSGAQVRNLEEALDAKIIDRTQLILDIFAQRAKTREGILQVELAQLSYLLPRLSGQGKNLSRLGGGIGTRGPGESKLETDRRHIRRRIGELKSQLVETNRHRALYRERRKKTGAFQVALVGYTNAGKSTLLRELTSTDTFVENKLFATLDPVSRSLMLPGGKEVIVIDTVGFIQDLPHELVAAFRSTLEEAGEADLLLHVVDSSSPMREEQMAVVDRVLTELKAANTERITVFNKLDRCQTAEADMLHDVHAIVKMSALDRGDVEKLKLAIESKLSRGKVIYRIPVERGDLIPLVYQIGDVVDQQADEDWLVYEVIADKYEYEKNGYKMASFEMKPENEQQLQ